MKNNVNTTKTPLWMVFYIEGASSSQYGTVKKKEYVKEGNAKRFARQHDTEVLPIVNGQVIS